MSKEAFNKECMEALRKKYPKVIFYMEKDFSVTGRKENKLIRLQIEDSYLAYKNAPDSLHPIIERYLRTTETTFAENRGIAIDRIVPVVKSAEYMEGVQGDQDAGEATMFVMQRYNKELVFAYAESTEYNFEYLNADSYKELHVSMDTLRDIAIRNLERIIPPVLTKDEGNGVYSATTGGGYEASIILVPALLTGKNLPLDGEMVIAVPDRDVLLITGSKNKAGIAKMRATAAEIKQKNPAANSEELFKWNGKKFERFVD